MSVPSMDKMMKAYIESASIERLKCGRPGDATVKNTLAGFRRFMRWIRARAEKRSAECAASGGEYPPVSIVRSALIHKYLADMLKDGTRPITAVSSLYQLRQLFAKWVLPYYEDRGWKIPPFPSFGHRPKAPRYRRPDAATLAKVKAWYVALPTDETWFAATMMLEFAMRNGDIMRLKRDNFVERGGRIFLNYVPHKTEHSSGRIVKWPVHPSIWERMRTVFTCGDPPALDEAVFDTLNAAMRALGFEGTKGAYELRKICVDHIYQKFGAEMAVSISGDDIRTIMHYYADPAQPNIGDIRVADLL